MLKACAAAPAELEIGGILLAAATTAHAARLDAICCQRRERRLGSRPIAFVLQPHLRLSDVRRNIANDAGHVLIENMRHDPCLLQAMQQQVGVESVQRGVEAFHAAFAGLVAQRRNMHYEVLGDPIFRQRAVPRQLELATARADGRGGEADDLQAYEARSLAAKRSRAAQDDLKTSPS